MNIIVILLMLLLHYGCREVKEIHGGFQDKTKKSQREFIDPELYRDHHGFIRDKNTNEIMSVQRIQGRLYTVNCLGKIVRDVTELEKELEDEGKVQNGAIL